ncbi:kinase domain protein [Aspergillus pseudodeflectus]|uniref:Kinase domain protein n=1 Tax=Aspergillus pseudodeflectus TaxID=176178 RepID=A0ABR4KPJ3_9EURO
MPDHVTPPSPLSRPTLIEEETLPHYNPAHYYPVKIGDVYQDRYQVAGKLGYGAYSTNWLCQDLQENKYKTLKVSTSLPDHPTATDCEVKIYEHLSKIESSHPRQGLLRELYDTFDLHVQSCNHQCLVLQPMHMTLYEMMRMNPKPFDLPLVKMTVRRLLLALDFLHCEAGTDNIMLGVEDPSMLTDFATAEIEDPSPRKVIDQSRTIYTSRRFRRPIAGKGYGLPILCDFGEARIGKIHESGPFVQPHIYRAPEVIFEMPWGCPIWDLFEGEHLFGDIFNSRGRHDAFKHLASMVALIGSPRANSCGVARRQSSAWRAHNEEPIPNGSLEAREKRLSGEEKELFLGFIRSMLKWMPEERYTAKQLLEHPFLL